MSSSSSYSHWSYQQLTISTIHRMPPTTSVSYHPTCGKQGIRPCAVDAFFHLQWCSGRLCRELLAVVITVVVAVVLAAVVAATVVPVSMVHCRSRGRRRSQPAAHFSGRTSAAQQQRRTTTPNLTPPWLAWTQPLLLAETWRKRVSSESPEACRRAELSLCSSRQALSYCTRMSTV